MQFKSFSNQFQQFLVLACQQLSLTVGAENHAITDKIAGVAIPVDVTHGDLTSTIALKLFGQLSEADKNNYFSPRDLATAITKQLLLNPDFTAVFTDPTTAGPGFINAFVRDQALIPALQDFTPQLVSLQPRDFVVEYSSPNIAKPFTIGHLRSTIIGDALANLLEYCGHTIYRDNHLGDWGTQFGKQIYAIKTWGDEQAIATAAHPVKELVALYVKFHQEAELNPQLEDEGRRWFKKLEDGDAEARRLWHFCIDLSWQEFSSLYQRLGITFTENNGRGYGESYFENKMAEVIEELRAKKLLTESKGAHLVFFENDKLPPLMILKQDGTTLYATRDLATDTFRLKKYGNHVTIINEVGAEQELYWRQLFEVESLLGWTKPGQRIHYKHGLYAFKDKKMSTRKGNVIWLDEVLQEAFDRTKKIAAGRISDETIWNIAIGALKWNDLKNNPVQNVLFDWDTIVRLDGNSGPYVQYTVTRAQSVLDKAANAGVTIDAKVAMTESKLATIEHQLLVLLLQFPSVVAEAAENLALHPICTYLFAVAQTYNTFYDQCSVLQADSEITKQVRLLLTQQTIVVLSAGLEILGIEVVSQM